MIDVAEIMCPDDVKNLARLPRMQAIYDVLFKIGAKYKPKSIFEIGVRAGYSAYAFITGSGQVDTYIGMDCDDRKHYGGPWLPWARKLFTDLEVPWQIWEQDSQAMTRVTGIYDVPWEFQFDLIHVDGDHTYEGCLHDMELCWPAVKPGGVMVVDDTTYLPGPRKACAEWGKDLADIANVYLEPSPTGSMVYEKRG